MTDVAQRIEALDTSLFGTVPDQLQEWDRRALLGLHSAVASSWDQFTYLEIGSYLGGSLQVLIRDSRCARIISIDPRLDLVPDNRVPEWEYQDNSTEHMVRLLRTVPGADLSKLVTLDKRAEDVELNELPAPPAFCFVDGEHTDEAVQRDADFCLAAVGGEGVIAFHDCHLVQAGIRAFLRAYWNEVSMALGFTGVVFAVEVGGRGALRSNVIERAISSKWHSRAWEASNRWWRSPHAVLATWTAIPYLDSWIARGRHHLRWQRAA